MPDTTGEIDRLAWWNASRLLAISNVPQLRVFDMETDSLRWTFSSRSGYCAAASSDGRWLARNDLSRGILCWDLHSGESPFQLPESQTLPADAVFLGFLPETSRLLAAVNQPDLQVWQWDVASTRLINRWRFENFEPRDVELSVPKHALIAVSDSALHVFNIESGDEVHHWALDGRNTSCLAAAPNEPLLAVGGSDRRIQLISLANGRIEHTLVGHLGGIDQLQFTPDGKTLLVLDERGQLKFWQVAHGGELFTWPSQESILAFRLSADANRLAICRATETEIIDIRPSESLE